MKEIQCVVKFVLQTRASLSFENINIYFIEAESFASPFKNLKQKLWLKSKVQVTQRINSAKRSARKRLLRLHFLSRSFIYIETYQNKCYL